jgi:hypothetical protein
VYNNIETILSIKTRLKNELKFISFKAVLSVFIHLSLGGHISAQSPNDSASSIRLETNLFQSSDTLYQNTVKSIIDWTSLPYFFDDMIITAGINRSSLYYTPNYLQITHSTGFQIGIENYYPVLDKAFLHYGLIFSRRGFNHEAYNVRFSTHNIDLPVYMAYELPAFREYDLRLFFGAQVSTMLGARPKGIYPTDIGPAYRYETNRFTKVDFGFTFGLSIEQKNYYTRFRIFNGYVKLMPDDQGMNASFAMDFGYFLFRGMRK